MIIINRQKNKLYYEKKKLEILNGTDTPTETTEKKTRRKVPCNLDCQNCKFDDCILD